jgi:hypothetical protein
MMMIIIRPLLLLLCSQLQGSISRREVFSFKYEDDPIRTETLVEAGLVTADLIVFRTALDSDLDLAVRAASEAHSTLRGTSRLANATDLTTCDWLCGLTRVAARWADRRDAGERSSVSRRTKCAAGLAVRLLPPADRARYRQEFAAELADLPRCDQAPYAFRLVSRAWSLRRALKEGPPVRSTKIVVVVGAGACSAAGLASVGWPAAFLGSVVVIALAWTISSADRTRHLASLIRTARKK